MVENVGHVSEVSGKVKARALRRNRTIRCITFMVFICQFYGKIVRCKSKYFVSITRYPYSIWVAKFLFKVLSEGEGICFFCKGKRLFSFSNYVTKIYG